MKESKYPVVAPSGRRYRVVVLPGTDNDFGTVKDTWVVAIYERRGWCWCWLTTDRRWLRGPLSAVEAVNNAVRDYDAEQSKLDGYAREYREWDGIVRKEGAR